MDRNTFFRVAFAGVLSGSALLLLQCNQTPPPLDSVNSGGAGEEEGTLERDAGGSSQDDSDATVAVSLDMKPLSWGTSDVPQGPEVLPASIDSNCGQITSKTVRQPVDVLLVLDRSGSMELSIAEDCYCSEAQAGRGSRLCDDTANCSTRWQTVSSALEATLSSTPDIQWGLKLFSTAGQPACTVSKGVEVAIAAGNADAIQAEITSTTPADRTPTAAAITAATAYLETLTDNHKRVILLATDGEPNCAAGARSQDTSDVQGTVAAISAASDAGFVTYVIGIGPSAGNLDNFAEAGQTGQFYPATTPADLANVLSSISKLVGSCSFTSDEEPPDPENIAVYVNGEKVEQDADNGWTFGATSREIVLTGDYCAQMSTGDAADVQILFGCPGQPGFPPKIY